MAASIKTLDSDVITLRQIYARTPTNGYIPASHVLISNGGGNAYWNSVSSITPPYFDALVDSLGSTLSASTVGHAATFSTVGIQGLFNAYVDPLTSTFTFSNAAPNLLVAQNTVPFVSRLAAVSVPNAENITMSTSQSTLKFIGVGDIQLSTITDLRSVFFSISSFTARGYADLSAVARAWPGYSYSTLSTNAGYASFISSIPFSTFYAIDEYNGYGWDWSRNTGSNLPMSTIEQYPSFYSTGDVYFSTVSFTAAPFLRYIHPNSTTRMFLEVNPNYLFQRMYLGTSTPYNLVKEFSTFVQYESSRGVQILEKASQGAYMLSQNSNAYSSNYFNSQIKLELDPAVLSSNALMDGAYGAYYTLYHRIPGAMANLLPDDYCAYFIGPRSGFSNGYLVTMDNYTPLSNAVFLHVYNQNGNAPPMPGP
ncbi:MAG: hypothetical protein EBU66_06080 [Bacteroidetes bacterium]|nr:hypothetical protein [Bacteroidota bacterium]